MYTPPLNTTNNPPWQDEIGINPWESSPGLLTGAVTANTGLIPDLFTPTLNPNDPDAPPADTPTATDMAGGGAATVLPWLDQMQSSGLIGATPVVAPTTGLESQNDLIQSMLMTGGDWSQSPYPDPTDPDMQDALMSTPGETLHGALNADYSDLLQGTEDHLPEGLGQGSYAEQMEGTSDLWDDVMEYPAMEGYGDTMGGWPDWMEPGTTPDGLSSGEFNPEDLGPYEGGVSDFISGMTVGPPEGWGDSPTAGLFEGFMPSGADNIFSDEGEFTLPGQGGTNPFSGSISTLGQFFPNQYPQE
tara:strand:- start:1933 stop:2838 length:906 start_codon:yes stop_codon:yes gene_type:complete